MENFEIKMVKKIRFERDEICTILQEAFISDLNEYYNNGKIINKEILSIYKWVKNFKFKNNIEKYEYADDDFDTVWDGNEIIIEGKDNFIYTLNLNKLKKGLRLYLNNNEYDICTIDGGLFYAECLKDDEHIDDADRIIQLSLFGEVKYYDENESNNE